MAEKGGQYSVVNKLTLVSLFLTGPGDPVLSIVLLIVMDRIKVIRLIPCFFNVFSLGVGAVSVSAQQGGVACRTILQRSF